MRISALILLIVIAALLVGCAATMETVKGIAADPHGFADDAQNAADNMAHQLPLLPYEVCIGLGYGLSFLRRLYVNIQKEKAKKAAA